MRQIEKYAVLNVIDQKWREHLREIDTLKEGINLRAYGQKDPLLEYKQEAYKLFVAMLGEIEHETLSYAFKLFPVTEEAQEKIEAERKKAQVQTDRLVARHDEAKTAYDNPAANTERGGNTNPQNGERRQNAEQPKQPMKAEKTPGRNDPCPCGSGKKYKNCCGK